MLLTFKQLIGLILLNLAWLSAAYAQQPFSFEWLLDASNIERENQSGFATRSLFTVGYEQNFSFVGGTLTPQISYSAFRGRNGSDIAQDVQGFSNIDAERFSAWQEVNLQYQHNNWLIRLGQLDANANFASLEHAGSFINASFGLTPTAFVLPTYPDMEYGAYGQYQTSDSSYVSLGYYRPDELGDSTEQRPLSMFGYCVYCTNKITVNLGYWQVKHQAINNLYGMYGYLEGEISSNWQGFALYSRNNVTASEEIKHHIKAGVIHQPMFAPEHNIGLAYSRVIGPTNETALELFYLWPITENISLQPDFQWLNDNDTTHTNASITTVRLIVNF